MTVDYISSTPKQTATGQCSKCGAFVVIDVLGDEKPTITTLQSCPRCTPDEYLTMSIATLEKQKADTLNKLSGISMQKAEAYLDDLTSLLAKAFCKDRNEDVRKALSLASLLQGYFLQQNRKES